MGGWECSQLSLSCLLGSNHQAMLLCDVGLHLVLLLAASGGLVWASVHSCVSKADRAWVTFHSCSRGHQGRSQSNI